MSSVQGGQQVGIILVTSLATFISGFILGVWSINGYIISPSLREERRKFLGDPVESEESDIDDDNILDHAPSWSNGLQADQKQGLRASAPPLAAEPKVLGQPNEECKLVLVVRTDLGMTKGNDE
jgi:peptidyl-tRNA hydrolase, PTH2 family